MDLLSLREPTTIWRRSGRDNGGGGYGAWR